MSSAVRYYSFPLLLALMLHAIAVWMLAVGWNPSSDTSKVVKPKMIMAKLLVLEAKATPKPVVARPAPVSAPVAKPKPVEKPKPDPAIERRKKAEEEAAERARAEAERQQRLAELARLADSDLTQAMEDESTTLQQGNEVIVAQSYQLAIYDLVRRSWSRPPSARNGMQARLLVELIPTGDVVSVTITASSGNAAFDRSAEQAVRRAGKFDVPEENTIFERYFRSFYFLFQPEDLLR